MGEPYERYAPHRAVRKGQETVVERCVSDGRLTHPLVGGHQHRRESHVRRGSGK